MMSGAGGKDASSGFLPPARAQTATPRGGIGGAGSGGGKMRDPVERSKSTAPDTLRGRRGAGASASVSREVGMLSNEVESLRGKLRAAQRQLARARAENVERTRQRSAMEDLFLRCVDTVKSQIQRRMPKGGLTYSPSGQAALRALDGGHTTRPVGSDADMPQKSVELDQFTKVDRRQVVEELLSHDEVLAYLYDALFPQPQQQQLGGNSSSADEGGPGFGYEQDEGTASTTKLPQAGGWRARVAAEDRETSGQSGHRGSQDRAPQMVRSRSTAGERIQLDPSVHDYLSRVAGNR